MSKSSSYRETFRRHRILLTAPIVIAMALAGWFVLGSAKAYQSTASLWVDNPAPADSSLGNLNAAELPPSQQEQNVVTELLATRTFVLTVGRQSALADYLRSSASTGFSPSALLSNGGSLDGRITDAIGSSQVTTSVPGPQVLQISYAGPTPGVAQSVLNSIVKQLQSESARFGHVHTQDAIQYYRSQVKAATEALTSARGQADEYRAQHRSAPANDPNLAALATAEGAAASQLTAANSALNGATSALNGSGSGSAIQVIDPASVPVGATTGKKKVVEGLVGGLLAGCLISLLGTIALTRGRPDPWEDEVNGEAPPPVDTESGSAAPLATANGRPTALAAHGIDSEIRGWIGGPGDADAPHDARS